MNNFSSFSCVSSLDFFPSHFFCLTLRFLSIFALVFRVFFFFVLFVFVSFPGPWWRWWAACTSYCLLIFLVALVIIILFPILIILFFFICSIRCLFSAPASSCSCEPRSKNEERQRKSGQWISLLFSLLSLFAVVCVCLWLNCHVSSSSLLLRSKNEESKRTSSELTVRVSVTVSSFPAWFWFSSLSISSSPSFSSSSSSSSSNLIVLLFCSLFPFSLLFVVPYCLWRCVARLIRVPNFCPILLKLSLKILKLVPKWNSLLQLRIYLLHLILLSSYRCPMKLLIFL